MSPKRKSIWLPIISKFRRLLASWKKNILIGGRVVLINSVMFVLPLYQMSIYCMPKTVLKEINVLLNGFFMGCN
ncbi:hypothetical protein REPUB_Repub19eG0078300 [Reevesia pubescens]